MRKQHFIENVRNLGPEDRFKSVFLVQSKEVRQKKRSNDQYLTLRLADRTGWLEARMWDNVSAVAPTFSTGDLVEIRGKVQEYNGSKQIIVNRLQAVPEAAADLANFVPHTKYDIETMYATVLSTIADFRNRHLKRLLLSIFGNAKFAAAYKRAPAASNMHHARIGGLLEHVHSVMGLAELISSHYEDIDRDLLISGVLLHDLGKIRELTSGPSFEYTNEGRLLGHIAIGSAWIGRRCDEIKDFPPRLKSLLQHMVLSHHGKQEFGSPQVPLFAEALALHLIDDLDSKLEIMRTARETIADGSIWSQYQRGLERVVLDKDAYLRDDPAWSPPRNPVSSGEDVEPETGATAEPEPVSVPPQELPGAATADTDSGDSDAQLGSVAEPVAEAPDSERAHGEEGIGESARTETQLADSPAPVSEPAPAEVVDSDLTAPELVDAPVVAEETSTEAPTVADAEPAVQLAEESESAAETGSVAAAPGEDPAAKVVPETGAEEATEDGSEREALRPKPVDSPVFVSKRPVAAPLLTPPDLPVNDQTSLFGTDEASASESAG